MNDLNEGGCFRGFFECMAVAKQKFECLCPLQVGMTPKKRLESGSFYVTSLKVQRSTSPFTEFEFAANDEDDKVGDTTRPASKQKRA